MKLTEGLRFIKENKDVVQSFVTSKIINGCEEDSWFVYNTRMQKEQELTAEVSEHLVDINIWRCEETGRWKSSAYSIPHGVIKSDYTHFVEIL